MNDGKRIFQTIVSCLCFIILLAGIASAKTQSRSLREFLAAGNAADLCYINPAGEATLIKDIQNMPPSPKLIDRLKNEGKLEAFLKQISASQKAVSSTGVSVNHTSRMMQIQSKGGNTISAVTGTQRAIVLFVDFSDNTSKTVASSFSSLLFGAGSSLTNYYQTISYGKLSVSGEVAGWFRAPTTYAYYCDGQYGTDGSYPKNAQKLVEDVVDLANASVNFAQYDTDGDNYVDALFVVHSGPGAEYTGSVDDIWSHAWGINPRLKDGVYISDYSMEPEYWASPGDMTIGVYCHELGHVFGLPDLYDTDNSSEGLGNWSLMAAGSWNGNDGDQPAFMDAWSRIYLGWVTPSTLKQDVNSINIPSAETTAVVYKLWSQGTANKEYYLVENRQKYSYDQGLPGSGLCIFHVDDNKSNNDSEWYPSYTTHGHYWVALEQADGKYALESAYNNRGDAGDSYPGTSLNYNFNSTTNPNSKSYSGRNVQVEVNNISSSSMNMTADMKIGIVPPDGNFNNASDTTVWAFQQPGGVTQMPSFSWISSYSGHTGILKLSYSSTAEGLKMTSIPRLFNGAGNYWYRLRVQYSSDSPDNGHEIIAQLLSYANPESYTITEVGGNWTGNGQMVPGQWYTYDAYVYSKESSQQIQLILKNNTSSGDFYIDSIQCDSTTPPAIVSPISIPIISGDFDVAADSTDWGFQSTADGVNGMGTLSWASSVGAQNGVLAIGFNQISQGVKITSVPTFTISTDRNALLSFKFRSNLSSPTTLHILGYLYGERDLATFKVDLAGKGVLGNFSGNQWNTVYVPLTSVSENTSFRLQLIVKNNTQSPETIYMDDVELYRSGLSLAAQQWTDARVLNEERSLFE